MIKSEYGFVEVDGTGIELQRDLCCAMRALLKRKIIDKKHLEYMVKITTMSSEELEEETDKNRERVMDKLKELDALSDMFAELLKKMEAERDEKNKGNV